MPMPYREFGLIKALAQERAAKTAQVSAGGSPVDLMEITREVARSTDFKTSVGKIAIAGRKDRACCDNNPPT
jgi:hypothetical protein